MSNITYRASGTITIDVVTTSKEEARRKVRLVAQAIRTGLPAGVTISIAEHHQSREPHVQPVQS